MGRPYGVSWIDNYSTMNQRPLDLPGVDFESLLPAALRTGRDVLGPGEHPFPLRYATRRATLWIEPSIYLDAMVKDVLLFGARIVIRGFERPRDLITLDEPVVVNCTGLGARELFGDDALIPTKGQLTVLVPQPEVNYRTSGGITPQPGSGIHMMPRADGIVLGGTSQRGEWSLEPDEDARRRVIEGHMALYGGMKAPRPSAT